MLALCKSRLGVVRRSSPGMIPVVAQGGGFVTVEQTLGTAHVLGYGRVGTLSALISFYLPGVNNDDLRKSHWNINVWTDEELLDWKKSHLSQCNAIAVATLRRAIFASVGLSALQLPNVNAIHWSARACFSTSMVFGIASVYAAAQQHAVLGPLNTALDQRLALSTGKANRSTPTQFKLGLNNPVSSSTYYSASQSAVSGKYNKVHDFKDLPLESSHSALRAVKMPQNLLDGAIIVFFVGFGLYELFLWVEDGGEDHVAYRNIWIVFVLAICSWIAYLAVIGFGKTLDYAWRAHDFSLHTTNSFRKSAALMRLRQDLETAQYGAKSLIAPHAASGTQANVPAAQLAMDFLDDAAWFCELVIKSEGEFFDHFYPQQNDIAISHAMNTLDKVDEYTSEMNHKGQSPTAEGVVRALGLGGDNPEAGVVSQRLVADLSLRAAGDLSSGERVTPLQMPEGKKTAMWQSFKRGFEAGRSDDGGISDTEEADLRGRFEAYWVEKQRGSLQAPGKTSGVAIEPRSSGAVRRRSEIGPGHSDSAEAQAQPDVADRQAATNQSPAD